MQVKTRYWQFKELQNNQGWYCWAYPTDNQEFEKWIAQNCPSADIVHRFNSGDPMYTVYIKDEKEAILFELKWK